ncbi:Acetylornithine deacetylase/Succinyl-diaminopimelate desuccinylase [Streptomyces zhaozhouensis]|uniref:Acetylornithine deacetylase/Succinyl-diaminopimelate desuccinylase n=1 Tax=Streptomyces zhaozhouensis TaxID=1300267 RepID=A0A286DXJ8_9ACTN|nr:M20/M25/M40 family metallo-hydrolase [Streptomyces zhaozhouensis]SOD63382.1 Acetylornithine deacetylase/Succinyl-diaminopimelate desuccinylase [Streptomyces zhaozhouensis]
MNATEAALTPDEHALLLDLLRLPTAGPLEAGEGDPPAELWAAGRRYARAAQALGLTVLSHAPPEPAAVRSGPLPAPVAAGLADPAFLAGQPSLLLRLGPPLPRAATVMCNVHLDTVAGREPVGFDGARFTGRGAVDAKGPAVALLAGVRAAMAREPAVGRSTAVLVQAVAGEEGGALGTIGTRPLVAAGHVGRINLFCEPTGGRLLTRVSAAATARITVRGEDAVDDRPGAGHNATVLLGFLAQHLAHALDSGRRPAASAPCVAGLHTGHLHNRVHGGGTLLLNLPYRRAAEGAALERALADALTAGLAAFRRRFAGTAEFARTARDAAAITRLDWDKRGLPTLESADPWAEELLARAGARPWPAEEPPFTCDALWLADHPDTFTAVLGPGSLDANHAHAAGEFVDVADLDDFAETIAHTLVAFARDRAAATPTPEESRR